MKENKRIYLAIDLKSFYASVECLERNLDPMTTNLVVADDSRTIKTICLAVSPSLKSFGLPGRPRLYQVIKRIKEVNVQRLHKGPGRTFKSESYDINELKMSPQTAISYIVASPRMELYMRYSKKIYSIYLKYFAPEDIHVYSIDEVFIDITTYLDLYKDTPYEIAKMIIEDVFKTTGVTATVGIGSNLYLAKVAMDIQAKHIQADKNGGRIAELDERSYRRLLWTHRPLTDFWRVGKAYATKLEKHGIYTMGDLARCSLGEAKAYHNEDLLYKLFGINAELLIDHAWGYEPSTMADVKAYKPKSNSIGSGQTLHEPYSFEKGRLIVKEMTDLIVLDLVEKKLVTDQMVLTIGYDIENLKDEWRRDAYKGQVTRDSYGREIPKKGHGTINLKSKTSSTMLIMDAILDLFDRIVDPDLLIRRVTIKANNVLSEDLLVKNNCGQLDMFSDLQDIKEEEAELEREAKLQETVIKIKNKYGKSAILKAINLEEGATTISRNQQIGGHKA